MPTTITSTSTFNVEATINASFRTALTAITRPSWLSTMPAIVTNVPEAAANLPSFSMVHLPVGMYDRWQGRAVGGSLSGLLSRGLLEVSVWVSRSDRDWQAQLRTMCDMVQVAATSTKSLVIADYATNQTAPSNTSALINFEDVQTVVTSPDPNPDIERRRMLIAYRWVYRQ